MVFLRVVDVASGRCYSKNHLQARTLVNYDCARGGIKVTCSSSSPYHHCNASSLKAMPACINEAHWKGWGMTSLRAGELRRALKPKQDPWSPTFKHSSMANIYLGVLLQLQLQGQKGLCSVYSSLVLQYSAPHVFAWMYHAFMHQGNAAPQSRPFGLSLKAGCWSWIARHTSFSLGFKIKLPSLLFVRAGSMTSTKPLSEHSLFKSAESL